MTRRSPSTGYNSLENPIGIETGGGGSTATRRCGRYNSLENPIGIETAVVLLMFAVPPMLQLIRKPDRD